MPDVTTSRTRLDQLLNLESFVAELLREYLDGDGRQSGPVFKILSGAAAQGWWRIDDVIDYANEHGGNLSRQRLIAWLHHQRNSSARAQDT